jgi:hypothetical protein
MGPFARGNRRSLGVLGNQPDTIGRRNGLQVGHGTGCRIGETIDLDIGPHYLPWRNNRVSSGCGSTLICATLFRKPFPTDPEAVPPPNQNRKNARDVRFLAAGVRPVDTMASS